MIMACENDIHDLLMVCNCDICGGTAVKYVCLRCGQHDVPIFYPCALTAPPTQFIFTWQWTLSDKPTETFSLSNVEIEELEV